MTIRKTVPLIGVPVPKKRAPQPKAMARHSAPSSSRRAIGGQIQNSMPAANTANGGVASWPSRLPERNWIISFRRQILRWFRLHQRDLPWRKNRDPYRVWISEIMLQQTQVNTVKAYFLRFMSSFPTVAALAAADEHDVLRHWEGLGYYRRARQLHAAAKLIVEQHEGVFPRGPADVLKLPGIGRYTAGAITSIAFDARQPILEANTIRLFSRLLAYRGETNSRAGQELLWQFAEALLPRTGSGELNQALMELGSQVCTPRQPSCDKCPVMALCPTRALGLVDSIPLVRKKPKVTELREAAIVVRRGNKVLLVQRGQTKRWAGLWDFPRFALNAESPSAIAEEVAAQIATRCRLKIDVNQQLATIKHGVTRFRISLGIYEASVEKCGKSRRETEIELPIDSDPPYADQRWLLPEELANYPLNTTGRKIARLIQQAKG